MNAVETLRFRERYESLHPLPDFPGEVTWIDRVRSWEDFIEGGKLTADFLEHLCEVYKKNQGDDTGIRQYRTDFRDLCPSLHDLLMEFHGKKLFWKV